VGSQRQANPRFEKKSHCHKPSSFDQYPDRYYQYTALVIHLGKNLEVNCGALI
jgi:hypothetical protein